MTIDRACPAGSGSGYPLQVLSAKGGCGLSAAIPHAKPHPPCVPPERGNPGITVLPTTCPAWTLRHIEHIRISAHS